MSSLDFSQIYPTASSVTCYINGGIQLDQLYQIQYKEVVDKSPIYGYNDVYFGNMARGRTFVNGVLVFNFISPETTNNIASVLLDNTKNYSKNLSINLPDLVDRKARVEYISSILSKENRGLGTKEELRLQLNKNNKVDVSTVSFKEKSNILQENTEALYLDIYYGQNPVGIRFNNVFFTDVSQSISQAGSEGSSEPLYEIYSFIARERKIITRTIA